jgi:AraC family transcriptional regulator
LGKIAVACPPVMTQHDDGTTVRRPARRLLAHGDGWSVWDVVCDAGPQDRRFEEQLSNMCIAIVAAGSFQYRASAGREVMTPGSLLLGNAGQHFDCGHEHAIGDRCISFSYEQRYFEGIAAEVGVQERNARFSILRVPAVRELSSLVVRACIGVSESRVTASDGQHGAFAREEEEFANAPLENTSSLHAGMTDWEEIGIELVGRALAFGRGSEPNRGSLPAAEARVTRVIRRIERHLESDHGLGALAREAKLSRYHFLRVFQQLTGLTPHQHVLRSRLRRAATRLMLEPRRVVDIALDAGFGDVSNFNHAFRAEFGVSPRSYRRNARNRMGL